MARTGPARLISRDAPDLERSVDFVHAPSQDSSCTTRNRKVVFSVEPSKTTRYIARAVYGGSAGPLLVATERLVVSSDQHARSA